MTTRVVAVDVDRPEEPDFGHLPHRRTARAWGTAAASVGCGIVLVLLGAQVAMRDAPRALAPQPASVVQPRDEARPSIESTRSPVSSRAMQADTERRTAEALRYLQHRAASCG